MVLRIADGEPGVLVPKIVLVEDGSCRVQQTVGDQAWSMASVTTMSTRTT
ncbi:MAG: hypothetical protein ABW137_12410 [Mycobacterium sp.]